MWARYQRLDWRRWSDDDPLDEGVSLDFAAAEEAKVDLLIGDLLDTVAGTTKPPERIAEHNWQLRHRVHEILEDAERYRVTATRHKRHERSDASRPPLGGNRRTTPIWVRTVTSTRR
jgi:hypothetical protein